jgi:cold shock CspA family protein
VWFDNGKNYGFIKRDDNGEDIYIHQEAVRRSNISTQRLRSGMVVKISTVLRKRVGKLMATNLVVLDPTTGCVPHSREPLCSVV